ncbi:MAG: hypothetical protein JST17_05285 [Bacteroidetes bacterium]|nr:hypothetical protein [Bacteroidota bacterium]MBS1932345.1 hypothetical protein [Bacteroidota bacterium]
MYNTIPDVLRKSSVESLFNTATFQNCWQVWQPNINSILGNNYSEGDIINLGEHLSTIFATTGGSGRGQGELSGGGTAWESLVCWYINLCTVGSRIVAIKKMSLVPKAIQDAITVNYGNFACNTESDITVIIFPDQPEYNTDISQLTVADNTGTVIPASVRNKFNIKVSDFLSERDFHQFEIGIIQCKTNWNDNAQIPMLWDMIYSAGGFRGRNITIGRNNFSIQTARSFTYSFVTVPSNQNAVYSPNSVAVKRVTNLSGGNYWGKQSVQHVAKSLKEIFTNNFTSGFRTTIRTDIRSALPHFPTGSTLDYFRL